MAKGVVHGIGQGAPVAQTTVSTTVTPVAGPVIGPSRSPQPSSNPPAQVMTGQIQDIQNPNLLVPFEQPYGAELGLAVDAKVIYFTANVNGQNIANSVRLLRRGEILSINADNSSGTLQDKATGNTLQFFHHYAQESGLVAQVPGANGTVVHFEPVTSPLTALPIAVALQIQDNNTQA